MGLKEKFLQAITPEPDKSLRKYEVTNGDNFLTDEGEKLYIDWMFKRDKDAFCKDVIPMLKEKEEKGQ